LSNCGGGSPRSKERKSSKQSERIVSRRKEVILFGGASRGLARKGEGEIRETRMTQGENEPIKRQQLGRAKKEGVSILEEAGGVDR